VFVRGEADTAVVLLGLCGEEKLKTFNIFHASLSFSLSLPFTKQAVWGKEGTVGHLSLQFPMDTTCSDSELEDKKMSASFHIDLICKNNKMIPAQIKLVINTRFKLFLINF
jgi:hypothetical protein